MKCQLMQCQNKARYINEFGLLVCGTCPVREGVDSIAIAHVPLMLAILRKSVLGDEIREAVGRDIGKKRRQVLDDVLNERRRQNQLRDEGRFPFTPADTGMSNGQRLGCLMEELGEVARAMLEGENAVNDKHNVDLRKELIQVAALAVAWVEFLDRKP